MDFHACRTTYINLLVDTGADVKTVQALARHSDPRLTMNVYARAKKSKLAHAVDAVGKMISKAKQD